MVDVGQLWVGEGERGGEGGRGWAGGGREKGERRVEERGRRGTFEEGG